MKQVRISEFKRQLSEHLRAAEGGQVIEVMDRARAIVRVVPIEDDGSDLEWIPAQRSFASVRKVRLPALKLPVSSVELLRHERGSR